MKKIYFLVLFWSLLPISLQAQSQYQQAADAALTNLDKSGITSGILYDRVFPAANLREPSASSSAGHFRQAQAELYYASYDRSDRLTPDDLKSLIWESEQQGIVPIGLLVADYQVLNTDAIELDNNQYRLKNRLKNGYSTGQLYQPMQAVVASALSTSVSYGSVGFQLPWWATFSNNRAITNVTIDFDNGQVMTLTPGGGPIYVNYGGGGQKTLRYTISLSDGSQRTTTSTLTVGNYAGCTNCNNTASTALNNNLAASYLEPDPIDAFGNIEKLVVESDEAFQGYEESAPSKGKGNAYFYYAQGRNGNELRKPFIVLDGFDAGDKRGPLQLYGERLKYGEPGREILLGDELRSIAASRQNQPDYNSDLVLLNFPNYEAGCVTQRICHQAGQYGMACNNIQICQIRDGGVDYIERNALVLVKLITIVNQRLQQSGSTEKITIVGPSMGGLISRYALRYMELRGMNHNCKIWVSFDSPRGQRTHWRAAVSGLLR